MDRIGYQDEPKLEGQSNCNLLYKEGKDFYSVIGRKYPAEIWNRNYGGVCSELRFRELGPSGWVGITNKEAQLELLEGLTRELIYNHPTTEPQYADKTKLPYVSGYNQGP